MTTSSPHLYDAVVVGAGLGGLLAADVLRRRNRHVLVVDKARGVGGRLATRRLDDLVVDHGAQFFTAYDPDFVQRVEEWVQAGVVRRWSTGFAGPDGSLKDNGVARYCGTTGMTAIAKYLAKDIQVRLQTKVTRVVPGANEWLIHAEDGSTVGARALLLTPPVPQTLALLEAAPVPLPPALRENLLATDYSSTLTLIVRLAGPSNVPDPGGIWMSGEPLLWITDNRRKGISPAGTVVTIHAGPEFSQDQWTNPDATITATMLEAAAPWIGRDIQETQLHRWKYSVPLRVFPDPFVLVPDLPPLVLAGDAFGGPRIEAAALSGLAAGAELNSRLG